MPRRLTTHEQSVVETVYETIATMLPAGDICEHVWIPDLIRGLGMQARPETIWQAIRDLLTHGLIETQFADLAKVSKADYPLLMRGPKVIDRPKKKKKDKTGKEKEVPNEKRGDRMMLGYVSLAHQPGDMCGTKGCSRLKAHTLKRYPHICCVDRMTEKDLSIIRVSTSKKSPKAIAEAAAEQAQSRKNAEECRVDLRDYDMIAVNSSGGKDSQAMLDAVMRECCKLGIQDRVRVYHGDLKDVEWSGSKEMAGLQAEYYGVPFIVAASDRYEDLLDHVSQRGEWPSGGKQSRQYCTADMKRQPINKQITAFADQWWEQVESEMQDKLRRILGSQAAVDKARGVGKKGNPTSIRTTFKKVMKAQGETVNLVDYRPKILNCIGVRAEESKPRAKKPPFQPDSKQHGSSGEKKVDTWFPIFTWSRKDVWEVIAASRVPHHWAYDLGMMRLSCVFCVMGNLAALAIGKEYNPELFQRYLDMEDDLHSRDKLICGSKLSLKPGCNLTAKAKREAAETGKTRIPALDVQGSCPLDYEKGLICVPIAEEMKAWKEGRRSKKPTIVPARTRQWRFGMGHSIREVAERIKRCKEDPTRAECEKLFEDPDSASFL
jgi:3'-phosphoadenosine 5'-phosphosulfate sulfotransferase (PAPS reductase)/FAD synthetase